MSNVELKGLRNLLGLDHLLEESKAETFKENILYIPIDSLISGKYQPRTAINEDTLQDLASSIKAQGILLPLIVRQHDEKKYEIIAGERRWRAAKIVQLKVVPVIIRDISDQTACAFSLIENIQRESLNAIDEALAFERLTTEFFLTHEEIAERVGRSRSTVTNLIRLLTLDDEIKDLLRHKKMEMGHARALLGLKFEDQRIIAKKIVNKTLTVRDVEEIVQMMKVEKNTNKRINPFKNQIYTWEQTLSSMLATDIKIRLNDAGEGKITISIQSPDDIKRLIDNIMHIMSL